MGVNINGQTDVISATDGSLTVSGADFTAVAAGSTAAPSITPTGDSNTGIFFPSADTIAFAEGGSEALRVDSNGRVGVNTTNPDTTLEVFNGTLKVASTDALNRSLTIDPGSNVTYESRIDASHSLVFRSYVAAGAGVKTCTFNTNGDLDLTEGRNLIFASGKGIDFSATANSSGTMTSELLSDYEEGTWTPTVTFGGGSTGITYSTQSGGYVKVGSKVTVWFYLQLSNKGSSTGDSKIQGLPYTNSSAAGRSEGATFTPNYWTNFNSAIIPGGYVQGNQSLIYMINTDGSMNTGTIANTVWSNSSAIYGCATYSTF